MSFAFFVERPELFPQHGTGTVELAIAPNQPGRVKFQATYWPARLYQPAVVQEPILPNQPVVVVGVEGITLLVMPV